jgi:coiled-coil domain-containing protein 63/114
MDGKSKKDNDQYESSAKLIDKRLKKWAQNNKEKKALMDKYIRNVKIIEDAFDQIKEQTGIQSNEEIVTTFIKAEEQNYSLYNYVNTLNSDMDIIEEANKNIQAEIEKHESLMKMNDTQKEEKIKSLQNELLIKRNMEQKEQEINTKEAALKSIQESVHKMQVAFQNSNIPLKVASPMQYDADTIFNDKNAAQYLAEIEEYIGVLITNIAYKQD